MCELIFMSVTGFKIFMEASNVLWLRVVKPLVLLHLIVCWCQTILVSLMYWTTPVKWPFIAAVIMLVLTDAVLLLMNNFIQTNYGRNSRKITTLFSKGHIGK